MTDRKQPCPGCMYPSQAPDPCPVCGYCPGDKQNAPFLPIGSDVGGRYVIGKVRESGGDGATYRAWDLDRSKRVFLREFLPDAIASRDTGDSPLYVLSGCEKVYDECRTAFTRLWDKLSKLNGLSSLISVRELVSDYGTVYAVYEDNGNITLDDYLRRRPRGRLNWDTLRPLLLPLLSTVATLHAAGILHGGISPQTVTVSPDGRFFLEGFTIIQARCSVGDLNASLYSGYSAVEQHGARQKIGTWTDVYALGALLYRCLVGQDPMPSARRQVHDELMIPGDVANALPPHVLNAMIDALQTKPENRTVEVEELRAGLLNQPFRKKTYPLTFYNYSDVSYVNQDRKPYVAQTEYYTAGNGIPKPRERGGANVSRSYEPQKPSVQSSPVPPAAEEKKSAAGKGIAAFVIVLVLLAGAVLLYLGVFTDTFRSAEEQTTESAQTVTYTVPSLLGRTDVSLKSDAGLREQFSLNYVEEYSVSVAAGYVTRQSPEAGQILPEGAQLTVYISLGPQPLTVPNVVGIDAQQAKTQLEAMGFVVETTEQANDGSHQEGMVASVSPDVGAASQQGETVTLSVWGAPPTSSSFQIGGNSSNGNSGGFDLGGLGNLFGLFG